MVEGKRRQAEALRLRLLALGELGVAAGVRLVSASTRARTSGFWVRWESRRSSSARSFASSSLGDRLAAVGRGPWPGSPPRPPSGPRTPSRSASRRRGRRRRRTAPRRGRSGCGAASSWSRRRAARCEPRSPSSTSSECSRWLIQTLRPLTIPAKSHLSPRPPCSATNSTLWRPPVLAHLLAGVRLVDDAGEVEADALDRQVAQDAVGVADVVEVGLDEDPRALVDLAELLVGEPQGVELALGAVLDEAGLVELDPGGALLGEPLDHLAVDLDQVLEQVERVEVLGDAVGRLREQQEADRADQHRHRVDPELLHRLGVLVERLRAREARTSSSARARGRCSGSSCRTTWSSPSR